MISANLDWITKEDAVVMYAFNHAVESAWGELDEEDIEGVMLGSTDEIQEVFEEFNQEERDRILSRINNLMDTYYNCKVYENN
jgi:hypothetical protein